MRLNSSYIIIPLITIVVAFAGKIIATGCDAWTWYDSLNLPILTPDKWVFPIVWNVIFALTTIAAIIVWNSFERNFSFWLIISLFGINALINISWTFFFFYQHQIGMALADAIALVVCTVVLIVLIGRRSKLTAALLVPYALWGCFAIYLNAMIWMTN